MPMRDDRWILTLNAGSSSLKYAAYPVGAGGVIAEGQVAGIGPAATLQTAGETCAIVAPDHGAAIDLVLRRLASDGLGLPEAVGHRVVHGGGLRADCRITPDVRANIVAAANFAPLHNPPALAGIDAIAAHYPEMPQVACFDTVFHADNPPEAVVIPLPKDLRAKGIRRYGFHGISYASLVRRFSTLTGQPLPRRLLACHLGAGASLAAIVKGRGVATTMGFSPMDGLVMATRAGSMDSGVLLHLMRNEGMDTDMLDDLLNRQSGLLALGGNADMRALQNTDTPEAKFAVAHFCYWVVRHAGSMVAAMGGLDGIVFTGGIGENSAQIREAVAEGLAWCGKGAHNLYVIVADEQEEIARTTMKLLNIPQ